MLEEAWRRAVLAEFVRQGWLDQEEVAVGMLAWRHSGFGAYVGPPIGHGKDLLRVARYSARAPVAESRQRYDAGHAEEELVVVDAPHAASAP